jgi:hypothetical protein
LRRGGRRGGRHIVVHHVVMMVVVMVMMMVMMVMMLHHRRGSGRGGRCFLSDSVSGKADRDGGRKHKALDHVGFILLGRPQWSWLESMPSGR